MLEVSYQLENGTMCFIVLFKAFFHNGVLRWFYKLGPDQHYGVTNCGVTNCSKFF